MKTYDIILIGTGQATGTILPALINMKLSIAVVESSKVGGTCVNWGCTPTKTLVASARAAHVARRGRDFGVDISDFTIDFGKVMQRVNSMRIPAAESFATWLKQVTTFHRGAASFLDDHTIKVGNDTLYGSKIIIHTGTRARIPSVPGIDTVPWLDNRGILELERLPEHLIVVGGSYIGLEFAQAFRRLGSKVSIIEHGDRIVPREDPDISMVVQKTLAEEGIDFHLKAELKALEKSGQDVIVNFSQGGRLESLSGSYVLLAVGRRPNTDTLNLTAAGVETDERGVIKVSETGQTSVDHIYALGDVNGRGAFTHTSVHDGQVFLAQLSGGDKKISDRIPIHAMYIDPPLARVGMSETEARQSKKKVLVATREMNRINRAKEKDETNGIIKLLVEEESNLILGATIFGVGGDEIIGMIALAMQAGLPYTKLQETVIPHPTVSELVPWIFADLLPMTS